MKKCLSALVIMVWALPVNAMFVSRTSVRRVQPRITQPAQHTIKRSMRRQQWSCDTNAFNTSAAELRACIENPENFSFVDVQEIINESLPNPGEFSFVNELEYIHVVSPCGTNGIIQHIVDKAVQYPHAEAQYADVLWRLSSNGWGLSDDCCKKTMLHSAVAHDLIDVFRALGACYYVYARDNKERTLLHYAQSPEMVQYLLKELPYHTTRDVDGNTPLHLVPASAVQELLHAGANPNIKNKNQFFRGLNQTPLRKAVAEHDVDKVEALLELPEYSVSHEEIKLLYTYVNLIPLPFDVPHQSDAQWVKNNAKLRVLFEAMLKE